MVHERERIEPDAEKHEQYEFYADQYCRQFPLVQDLIHDTVDHVAAEHAAE
jgi:sugar kinase, putative xylulose kinase